MQMVWKMLGKLVGAVNRGPEIERRPVGCLCAVRSRNTIGESGLWKV